MEKIKKHWQVWDAMIDGATKGWLVVDTKSLGHIGDDGIAYGDFAANTLCELLGRRLTNEELSSGEGRREAYAGRIHVMINFEHAIDALRQGYLHYYDRWIRRAIPSIVSLPDSLKKVPLPVLTNTNFRQELTSYKKFRDSLKLADI